MGQQSPRTTAAEFMCYAMLCYAKSLQSCPTLCDPIDGSHQAPPSLGFSRQEHWSGLPFPSPKHESDKWKLSRSVVSNFQRPRGLQPTRLFCPWDFPGKSTGVGCHCLQLLKSVCFRAHALPQEKLPNEKPEILNEDPAQPQINKYKIKIKVKKTSAFRKME